MINDISAQMMQMRKVFADNMKSVFSVYLFERKDKRMQRTSYKDEIEKGYRLQTEIYPLVHLSTIQGRGAELSKKMNSSFSTKNLTGN
jgi:hypothetical protein